MNAEQQDAFQAEFEIHEEVEQEAQEETQEEAPQEPQQEESQEAAPEEAPEEAQEETPEQPGKVEFTDEQQEIFNREIGKKIAKAKQAEREAEELRQKLAEAELKLNPEPEAPQVPPMPDPYDPDYQAKMAERDAQLAAKAEYDAQQRIKQELEQARQQEAFQKQAREAQEKVQSYVERGEKLGHSQEDLVQATKYLMDVGIDAQAQSFMRDDDNGPDMAIYLAKNPQQLSELLDMQKVSPHMAFAKLVTEVKTAASVRTPPKLPPDPPTHLKGKGAPEKREGPPGATFE